MQRVNAYRHAKDKPPYIVNLDPAVTNLPYDANVDIRDTVDYKNVMKEYNLGRGLQSSTFQLNLSALYGIGDVRKGLCSPWWKGFEGVFRGV